MSKKLLVRLFTIVLLIVILGAGEFAWVHKAQAQTHGGGCEGGSSVGTVTSIIGCVSVGGGWVTADGYVQVEGSYGYCEYVITLNDLTSGVTNQTSYRSCDGIQQYTQVHLGSVSMRPTTGHTYRSYLNVYLDTGEGVGTSYELYV
jgi:hypothetical protein